MKWDEAAQTLTIGDRVGTFPGMLTTRTFRIEGKDVAYSGKQVTVSLR